MIRFRFFPLLEASGNVADTGRNADFLQKIIQKMTYRHLLGVGCRRSRANSGGENGMHNPALLKSRKPSKNRTKPAHFRVSPSFDGVHA
jgi:hypothetical protein